MSLNSKRLIFICVVLIGVFVIGSVLKRENPEVSRTAVRNNVNEESAQPQESKEVSKVLAPAATPASSPKVMGKVAPQEQQESMQQASFPPKSVIADGAPLTIEFNGKGATISTINIKRNTSQVLIFKALPDAPAEGIDFLNTQGTYIGIIRPGESKTVHITPQRTFLYVPNAQDHIVRYPYAIVVNIH